MAMYMEYPSTNAPATGTARANTSKMASVAYAVEESASVITSYSIHYTKLYDAVAAGGWRIGFRPHPNFMLTGNDPLRIIDALGDLGSVTATPQLEALPAFDALDPEQCLLAWNLELTGERNNFV